MKRKINLTIQTFNKSIGKNKQKSIHLTTMSSDKLSKMRKFNKPLSYKLYHNIIKESLILGLREELNYNKHMNEVIQNYLDNVRRVKEKVKFNKEEVENNRDSLIEEFHERFLIVQNFEKQIEILNNERKEIIRENNDIIAMRKNEKGKLLNQLNKIQKEIELQRNEIDIINKKIFELEQQKNGLIDVFEQTEKTEKKNFEDLKENYIILAEKCDYYQIQYDTFDKTPNELLNERLNLFDNTKTKNLLEEENLKVILAEKNFIKNNLIDNIKELHIKINKAEQIQKEIKEKENLYGKSLESINNMHKRKNYSHSKINLTDSNRTYKRNKTISDTKRRSLGIK